MEIQEFIRLAIQEDVGSGDHTSLSCIPENTFSKARLLVKDEGILAGLEIGILVLKTFDPSLIVEQILVDGTFVKKGEVAFTVEGSARSILTCRTPLFEHHAANERYCNRYPSIGKKTRRHPL